MSKSKDGSQTSITEIEYSTDLDYDVIEDSHGTFYALADSIETVAIEGEDLQQNTPVVLSINETGKKPHRGYFPEDLDNEVLRYALDAIEQELEEKGYEPAIQLTPNSEKWEEEINSILTGQRDKITKPNRGETFSRRDAYTKPIGVDVAQDDLRFR